MLAMLRHEAVGKEEAQKVLATLSHLYQPRIHTGNGSCECESGGNASMTNQSEVARILKPNTDGV